MTEKAALDLEKDLRNDRNGTYKSALICEFAQEAYRIKRVLQNGVKPNEYEKLSLLADAFEAASAAIEGAWREIHPMG